MKRLSTLLIAALLAVSPLHAQHYLMPSENLKVAYADPGQGSIQNFDIGLLYAYYNSGDTVYQVSLLSQEITARYPKPVDYQLQAYPSFLTLSPDELSLWVGYTDQYNLDARIYVIDLVGGTWKHAASMAGNFDLELWNDSILVSGLNSADYMAPNGIYVLDTTGNNQHRLIIETGGSSAGLAVDQAGNLYYGTSFFSDPNGLYHWSSAQVQALVDDSEAAVVDLSSGEKLADLPMSAYDCEVDEGGNLVFTMNVWGGTQVLGAWNGLSGDGANYDTLAVSVSWLGLLKSRGNFLTPSIGNSLLIGSYGLPVADVHSSDYEPIVLGDLPALNGYMQETMDTLFISDYVLDMDDHDTPGLKVKVHSSPEVATLEIQGDTLSGLFGSSGQSNLVLELISGSDTLELSTLLASWTELEGEYHLTDFEDLQLDRESYWNGSDGSGEFTSGKARFHNAYNPEYFSWSGWSYSNMSDDETPGFMNQYSAITGGAFPSIAQDTGNYGVSSLYGSSILDFPEKAHAVEGFFVTNATYTALSMEQGDDFAKKFGGREGDDPDYFLLKAWGHYHGLSTDTLEYYLADYRFEENELDYIIKSWQWFDLSSLGKVDSLSFGLESSDNSDWGMNTPAYFCMDDLHVIPDAPPYVENPIPDFTLYLSPGDTLIDLAGIFTDPDDEDSLFIYEVYGEGPLQADLDGPMLSLTNNCHLVKGAMHDVELVIEASIGGLSAFDTVNVSLECTSTVVDEALLALNVYPNPARDQFRVEADGPGIARLEIYNLSGVLVLRQDAYYMGEAIDVSGLASGAYVLRVSEGNRSGRLLIQKQ